jgi:hypothetical protein
MAIYNPEEKQLNVVIIGNFNPRIFQPHWFASNEIISEADLTYIQEQSNILVHKQISQFQSSWFVFEVTETRLQIISTQEAYFEMILDFLVATFSILIHTPIQQMGINLRATQSLEKNTDVSKFDNEYFSTANFLKFDEDVQPTQMKLRFFNENIKIGTACNFELSKISEKTYLLNINQHFELGMNSNGGDFVRAIQEKGRKAMNTNDSVLKNILEKRIK